MRMGTSDHSSVNQTRQTVVVRPAAAVLPPGIPLSLFLLPAGIVHIGESALCHTAETLHSSHTQVPPLLIRSFDSCNVTGQKLELGG